MGIVVGIDIGGSTTKIVGFGGEKMLIPAQIAASNAIASLFGAFGTFLYDNKLGIEDISQVNLTGVGALEIKQAIYDVPTYYVDEFTANGLGGGYFAGDIKKFMVVSMGTGTSFVGVDNGVTQHLGGIGIGGGTINGLSKYILGTSEIEKIKEMASEGDVGRIDLRVGDICVDSLPGLNLDITASNFGKSSSRATMEDKAAGITHMVIESICQTASLIGQRCGISDFVLLGALTNFNECGAVSEMIHELNPDSKFIIPKDGEYGTAIGCALADKSSARYIAG